MVDNLRDFFKAMYKKVANTSHKFLFLFGLCTQLFPTFLHLPILVTLQVTEEDIDEFEANYRGSESEKKDLIELYKKFKGKMSR